MNEKSIQDLWDTIKRSNIHGYRKHSEIIAENAPYLRKDMNIQVQEAFRTLNRHDQKRTSPQHIIVKLPKVPKK